MLWPLLLLRLVAPALVLGGVNSPSPLQHQPGFCGFAVPSIICPTSRLRGCSPLHRSPCTTDFIILIILPFSSPFPSLRGFEGSKPFLMPGERLPCPLSPGGPRTRLAAGRPLPSCGAPRLILFLNRVQLGASDSAALLQVPPLLLPVIFLPPCQSETRTLL